MSEISKERAQEIFLGNGPEPTASEEWELARIALDWLALRERAEPVPQLENLEHFIAFWRKVQSGAMSPSKNEINYTVWFLEGLADIAAPPAPVVHAETFDEWSRRCEIQLTLCRPEFREVAEITWKACRAEMLTAPPAPVVPEWTNQQCLEFLAIAFRHAEIKGDFELDDLRLGVKMANAMTPGKEG